MLDFRTQKHNQVIIKFKTFPQSHRPLTIKGVQRAHRLQTP